MNLYVSVPEFMPRAYTSDRFIERGVDIHSTTRRRRERRFMSERQTRKRATPTADPLFKTVELPFETTHAAIEKAGSALHLHLSEIERAATAYLKSQRIPTPAAVRATPLPADRQQWAAWCARKDADPRAQDAWQALLFVQQLRDDISKNSATSAAYTAIRLTQARMQFDIRPLGPLVSIGKKVRAGANAGGQAKRGKTKKTSEEIEKIKMWREAYRLKHPTFSAAQTNAAVSKEFGISVPTLNKYLLF